MTLTAVLHLAVTLLVSMQVPASPDSAQSPFNDPELFSSDAASAHAPLDDRSGGMSERGEATELWFVRAAYVIVADDDDATAQSRKDLTADVRGRLANLGVPVADSFASADAVVSVTLRRGRGNGASAGYTVAGLVVRTKGTLNHVRTIFSYTGTAAARAEALKSFVDALASAANAVRQ